MKKYYIPREEDPKFEELVDKLHDELTADLPDDVIGWYSDDGGISIEYADYDDGTERDALFVPAGSWVVIDGQDVRVEHE